MAKTPPRTVDEYLQAQPDAARPALELVRATIRGVLPDAEEVISYQMPAYKVGGRVVVYFAGWKRHYALYPVTDPAKAVLGEALAGYELEKGTVRFAFGEDVPVALIERITSVLAELAAARTSTKRKK